MSEMREATVVDIQDWIALQDDLKEAIRPYLDEGVEEEVLAQAASAAMQSLVENGVVELES